MRGCVAGIVVIKGVVLLFSGGNGPTIQYQTQVVRRGDLQVTVSATGTLAPLKKVDVGIEVSGTIKSVEVDYNDRVEISQVLAILNTTRLEAQALQPKAPLLQVPWVLDLPVIVEAFAFSAGVSIVFGYVPACKAARMDPIRSVTA